jgi:hypothetical protein
MRYHTYLLRSPTAAETACMTYMGACRRLRGATLSWDSCGSPCSSPWTTAQESSWPSSSQLSAVCLPLVLLCVCTLLFFFASLLFRIFVITRTNGCIHKCEHANPFLHTFTMACILRHSSQVQMLSSILVQTPITSKCTIQALTNAALNRHSRRRARPRQCHRPQRVETKPHPFHHGHEQPPCRCLCAFLCGDCRAISALVYEQVAGRQLRSAWPCGCVKNCVHIDCFICLTVFCLFICLCVCVYVCILRMTWDESERLSVCLSDCMSEK